MKVACDFTCLTMSNINNNRLMFPSSLSMIAILWLSILFFLPSFVHLFELKPNTNHHRQVIIEHGYVRDNKKRRLIPTRTTTSINFRRSNNNNNNNRNVGKPIMLIPPVPDDLPLDTWLCRDENGNVLFANNETATIDANDASATTTTKTTATEDYEYSNQIIEEEEESVELLEKLDSSHGEDCANNTSHNDDGSSNNGNYIINGGQRLDFDSSIAATAAASTENNILKRGIFNYPQSYSSTVMFQSTLDSSDVDSTIHSTHNGINNIGDKIKLSKLQVEILDDIIFSAATSNEIASNNRILQYTTDLLERFNDVQFGFDNGVSKAIDMENAYTLPTADAMDYSDFSSSTGTTVNDKHEDDVLAESVISPTLNDNTNTMILQADTITNISVKQDETPSIIQDTTSQENHSNEGTMQQNPVPRTVKAAMEDYYHNNNVAELTSFRKNNNTQFDLDDDINIARNQCKQEFLPLPKVSPAALDKENHSQSPVPYQNKNNQQQLHRKVSNIPEETFRTLRDVSERTNGVKKHDLSDLHVDDVTDAIRMYISQKAAQKTREVWEKREREKENKKIVNLKEDIRSETSISKKKSAEDTTSGILNLSRIYNDNDDNFDDDNNDDNLDYEIKQWGQEEYLEKATLDNKTLKPKNGKGFSKPETGFARPRVNRHRNSVKAEKKEFVKSFIRRERTPVEEFDVEFPATKIVPEVINNKRRDATTRTGSDKQFVTKKLVPVPPIANIKAAGKKENNFILPKTVISSSSRSGDNYSSSRSVVKKIPASSLSLPSKKKIRSIVAVTFLLMVIGGRVLYRIPLLL